MPKRTSSRATPARAAARTPRRRATEGRNASPEQPALPTIPGLDNLADVICQRVITSLTEQGWIAPPASSASPAAATPSGRVHDAPGGAGTNQQAQLHYRLAAAPGGAAINAESQIRAAAPGGACTNFEPPLQPRQLLQVAPGGAPISPGTLTAATQAAPGGALSLFSPQPHSPVAAPNATGECPQAGYLPNPVTFLSSPLGVHVPPTLREKIWRGEFVELAKLLPANSTAVDDALESKTARKQPPPPLSIADFMSAFHTLVAIRTERFPAEAPGMLKHADTVQQMHTMFGPEAWRFYDRQYRLAQQHNPDMKWGLTHGELYMQATALGLKAASKQPQRSGGSRNNASNTSKGDTHRRNLELRPNTCWTYQFRGICDKKTCPYPLTHNCYKCQGNHPTSQCVANRATQQPPSTLTTDVALTQQPFRSHPGSLSAKCNL